MDENEFRRILELFPIVRPRDYHADMDATRQSSGAGPSREAKEWQDAWGNEGKKRSILGKTKAGSRKKMGAADAERFCRAFQQVYKKLVYEELTPDAARRILNSRTS